jgi:hypothetical protein
MLAGAVMAAGLQQPFLVVPLAFASHFVLDVLPHFGINEPDVTIRNRHPLFRYIVVIDTILAITLLALLPFLAGSVSWWILGLGMLCAWGPDALWVAHFVRHLRGRPAQHNRFTHFHQRIQWFERPVGLIVELVWFAAMGVFLGYLLA